MRGGERRTKVDLSSDNDVEEIPDFRKASCLDAADRKTHTAQIALWEAQFQQLSYAKCPYCYCRRTQMKSILNHFKLCSSKRPDCYSCRHCSKEFQSAAGLKYHLMAAHGDTSNQAGSSENASESPQPNHANLPLMLRKLGKLTCRNEGCGKTFTTVNGFLYHRNICGKKGTDAQFKCELCDKMYHSKAGVSYHMKTSHAPPPEETVPSKTPPEQKDEGGGRSKRKAAQRALSSMHELTQNLMESSKEGEGRRKDRATNDHRQKTKKKKSSLEDKDSGSDGEFTDCHFQEDSEDSIISEDSDSDVPVMSRERRHVNYRHPSIKELIPVFIEMAHSERVRKLDLCTSSASSAAEAIKVDWSAWTPLSQSESSPYLPQVQESVHFTLGGKEAGQEPSSLALFQTSSSEAGTGQSLNLFVGGPVWSMAWCPHPAGATTESEYAVISCHLSPKDHHYATKTYVGPGAVQLWSFSGLQEPQSQPKCQLVCCMAHEYGCIWDLKWCPSGCWQAGSADPSALSRLGMLALACSDGSVRLVNIPTADCVEKLTDARLSPTVLRMQPSVTLRPQHQALSATYGQCWCVDWAPDSGHTKIAAGFSRGTVAVWDLLSQSPLLRVSGPDGVYALPYCLFEAHDTRVVSLSWCPYDANFVATASFDRCVKFWDVRTPEVALASYLHGPYTSCKWMNYFNVVAASHDCSSGILNRASCYFTEGKVTEIGQKRLFTSKSTCWNVDYSDWLNSLLLCSDSGDVLFLVLPKLDKCAKKDDRKRRTWLVYSTTIHQASPSAETPPSECTVVTASVGSVAKSSRPSGELPSTSSLSDVQTSQHTTGCSTAPNQLLADSANAEQVNDHGSTTEEERTSPEQAKFAVSASSDSQSVEPHRDESLVNLHRNANSVRTHTGREVERRVQEDGHQPSKPQKLDGTDVLTEDNRLSTNHETHRMRTADAGASSSAAQLINRLVSVITTAENCTAQNEQQRGLMTAACQDHQDPDAIQHQGPEHGRNQGPEPVRHLEPETVIKKEPEMISHDTWCSVTHSATHSIPVSCEPVSDAVHSEQHSPVAESGTTWRRPTASSADSVHISFKDAPMDDFSNEDWLKASRAASSDTDTTSSCDGCNQPMSVAVHRACFNPNLGTHTWILSGGQTGIVRAHSLKALQLKTAINKIRNRAGGKNSLFNSVTFNSSISL
ncbi:uncharacterized protein LOC110986205 isoform X2 [Acanthaster planci]|nr:uncharacterized protein LOC110986205 isoform X2 [Acanthaster planci]